VGVCLRCDGFNNCCVTDDQHAIDKSGDDEPGEIVANRVKMV